MCFPVNFAKFLRTTSGRLLLWLELWNVEFWRLKKLLWKPSVFLNMLIKHIQEKKKMKFDCKKKNIFYLNFSSIATLKIKKNIFFMSLCFLSLYLFWLTACTFDFFYLRINLTIINWYKWNIRKVKQAPKSMIETLCRLGILWWLVKA